VYSFNNLSTASAEDISFSLELSDSSLSVSSLIAAIILFELVDDRKGGEELVVFDDDEETMGKTEGCLVEWTIPFSTADMLVEVVTIVVVVVVGIGIVDDVVKASCVVECIFEGD